MRDRKEIETEFDKSGDHSARRQNEQILEVLLDVRELLEEQKNAPQIKIKISEAQEPSVMVESPTPTGIKFPAFNKTRWG